MEIKERNKTELNVLTRGYLPLTYYKNWFHNIGQFFRNIKYAYQRITKGYCDYDLFSLDNYYLQLFYHTIMHFANNLNSYPSGVAYEDWQNYLVEMASHFENAEEWNEEVEMNKTTDTAYDKAMSYVISGDHILDPDNTVYSNKEAFDAAMEKWFKLDRQAYEYRESEKNKGLDMMKDKFFELWD